VNVKWGTGRWHRVKFGKIVGIHLWSPEGSERKYPYLAYDYSPFEVAEWVGQSPRIHVGDAPQETPLYMYNYTQESRGWGIFGCAIGKVQEGAEYVQERRKYRPPFWEATNISKVINHREVDLQAARLALEASRRGWSVARSTREENLLAVWAVQEGLVPEIPVAPNRPAGIVSAAEPLEGRGLGIVRGRLL